MLLNASPICLDLVKAFEGCHLRAYPDPKTNGAPWTIGWGHTGADVRPGENWTQAQADAQLVTDLSRFVRDVNRLIAGRPTTQGQFDALVSFAYNCGSDIDADTKAEGLGDSTLLRKHLAGDYGGAVNEFAKWISKGTAVERGLRRRRAAEALVYLGRPWR